MDLKSKIRVLVVDDSAFMRVAMRKMMEADKRIEVIDTAKNGEDAIHKISKLKPDLVTMDIEMPEMDGLTALEIIMDEMPLPVIMISSLTEKGADATFRALELGAIDYIPKSGKSHIDLDIIKIAEQLRFKVIGIAAKRLKLSFLRKQTSLKDPTTRKVPEKKKEVVGHKPIHCELVTLGISTGGPMALQNMLPEIPATLPASILIVQHMPPAFTGPFAKRLNSISKIHVKEAEDNEILAPGIAYVAPGGLHLKTVLDSKSQLRIHLDPEPGSLLFIPSVDIMMQSVVRNFEGYILGCIMTGMGNDGLQGMRAIKEHKGVTIAQDEASCVVYGMPKVCVDEGIIDHVVPLDEIAHEITEYSE